jgi:hypothetical protein
MKPHSHAKGHKHGQARASLTRANGAARERFHIDHTTIQIEELNIPQELVQSCDCRFGAWDSP